MIWRRGESQESYDAQRNQPARPWLRGAQAVFREDAKEVVLEKWDDEIPQPTVVDEAADAARRARAQLGPTTRHVVNLLLFAAAVIGAVAGVAVAWMHIVNDPLADARAYYDAAVRLNQGRPLYPEGISPNGNEIYLYPPLLALALRPLALLPFEAFALLWELVVIAAFVALVRYLGVRRKAVWLAIGILGVPIGWCLTIAQAHVPLTFLLALGQPWSIALAANLKLTPVVVAIWWLGRRDFQSFMAFLAWMGLFAAIQVALATSDSVAFFSSVGLEQIGEVRNISPYAISPALWIGLVLVGILVVLALARTRWGWAAAVTLATVSPPRLLVYMLMGLLAALRHPRIAGEPDPNDLSDPSMVYGRSFR
ncbi:MAG TPA: glycosyltransferase 87 family protein [Candidatus Binatia bacterium]|nr:glycosyltransferase 87 family protein [Candidatus Binatia bacterium]